MTDSSTVKAGDTPIQSAPSASVKKPSKGFFQLFGEVLDHGGPGYLQFAITNICNAKCDFCNFAADRFDPAARRSVTLAQAKDVIDIWCAQSYRLPAVCGRRTHGA